MIDDYKYKISEKRQKVWAVQLDLLEHLLDICKAYEIPCFVIWGTLLETVRHKGFIPWDDDLDVAMSRENFTKLCNVASGAFSNPYFFQTARTDREFFFSYARLRNSDTTGIIKDFSSPNYNCGIFIDIYPLDGLCEVKWKYHIQRKFIDLTAALARAKTNHRNKNLKSMLLKIISFPLKYDRICDFHDYWCKKYNDDSSKVGLLYNRNLLKNYQFKKEYMNDITELLFENIYVPVPKKYDELLSEVYGDYMTPPPTEQRGKWHADQIIYEPEIRYKNYFNSCQ